MSAPTRQFHRLSIGHDMPETRFKPTRKERPDPSDDSEREDSSVEESETESEEEESSNDEPSGKTILARSGITYDMKELDDETGANASVGLRSQFEVVNCRASDSGYDFQLLDRPQVHVGSDSTTCTCSTFQSRPQAACQHIFWVLDQLHAYFHPTPSTARATLSSDGRPQVRPRAEELLNSVRLETVADRLQWQCLRDEGNGHYHGMTRADKIRDVLSAFNTRTLLEDFRQDLQEKESTQKYTAESCVVQGDLEATIFRLAVHDDSVFSSICKAMPSGACAAIYFQKLQDQIRRLLSDFDRYCATGERPTDPSSPGGGIVEVEEVVRQLRRAVSRIRSNIAIRSPHGSDGAADALVLILENIAARNKDCLAGNDWGRTSFHGEDEDQRNLHHLLIGSDDVELKADDELFLISALEDLNLSSLGLKVDALRNCLSKMEVNRAPKAYLIRLGALVRLVESGGAGISGSGQKRPAAGNSGGFPKRSR
ncbi:hypothetical protein N7486_001824 [Penicillium sp. IBT 16267x]|nr:hypothetical protein N7486_001824 [Penicillium sp. IBT 16267x]